MECGNLRTSHQWLKRKKHSTSKLGAECFIFLCCIFCFVLHWKAECCISWFCVATIFSIWCNQWMERCKEKIKCCNQKIGVAFVSFCESFAKLKSPKNGLNKPFFGLFFLIFSLENLTARGLKMPFWCFKWAAKVHPAVTNPTFPSGIASK